MRLLLTFIVGLIANFLHFGDIYSQNNQGALIAAKQVAQEQTDLSYVIPWRYINIEPETRGFLRPLLQNVAQQFAAAILQSPQKASDYIQSTPNASRMLLNQKKTMNETWIGRLSGYPIPLVLEPVLCNAGQFTLAFLIAKHKLTGEHYAIDHSDITGIVNNSTNQPDELQNNIGRTLEGLYQNLQGNSGSPKAKASELKVGLSLKRETTRRDNTSSYCFNLLLVQVLQSEYRFVAQVNDEWVGMITRILPGEISLSRPNRHVSLHWDFGNIAQARGFKTVTYKATLSDSVFGKSFGPVMTIPEPIDIQKATKFQSENFTDLMTALNQEQQVLSKSGLPQYISQSGAWVYLDKGRAWGLQINDRLIATNNPDIKGHIIGFYGPEIKMKTRNDLPVHEGAILFVREGLSKLSGSEQFQFDPRVYP